MKDFRVNYHASVCIDDDVYIDPLNIEGEPHNAKIICITHLHWDHLSVADIKKVMNENTHFVAPQDCIDALKSEGFELEDQKNYWAVGGKSFDRVYNDGENLGYQVPNTNVWLLAFPSYNIDKQFHPKDKGWVGFILTIDNVRYVICGDTDFTPELKKIKCEVLFVPIGGNFTMNAAEAAECVNIIKPKIAVPIHYLLTRKDGTMLGGKEDEKVFIQALGENIACRTFF